MRPAAVKHACQTRTDPTEPRANPSAPNLRKTQKANHVSVVQNYLCHLRNNPKSEKVGGQITYADDVHEAVHAVADLEEQVLALPLGRRAEGGPDEPGDAGDEEQGAQDDGGDLHLLNHGQGDGLPLVQRQTHA